MYPGYSPADHIYGEAAQEFGAHAAELKRKGMDLKLDPNGPEYVVGQNKKPRNSSQEPGQMQPASVSSSNEEKVGGQAIEGDPMEGVEQSTSESQYFVIDSKPSPISDVGEIQKHKNKANDKAKRRVSFKGEQDLGEASINSSDTPRTKRAKASRMESPAAAKSNSVVPEEDLSAEVEARLKAKEEKRKRKEEKKRKRDSGESLENIQAETSATLADRPIDTLSTGKPKKKMHKKNQIVVTDEAEPQAEAIDDQDSKREKKKKKDKADAGSPEGPVSAPAESEEPKKKRKKDTASK